jgi:molybdopterin/thiamine biosynthesis adenylyltransferase
MSSVSYERQNRILDPGVAARTHITVCGVGTVGSNVAVQLARAGFGSLDLWDMDRVEGHNLPSQDFSVDDVGMLKTQAAVASIRRASSTCKIYYHGEITGYESFSPGLVVLAVDNMELRKTIFDNLVDNSLYSWVFDFRMGGWNLQVWCVDPCNDRDVERYRNSLYSSDEVVPSVCGTRTFAPIGALSGAVGTCLVTQCVMGSGAPFYTSIDMSAWTMSTAGMRDASMLSV